jgi:hypothetical protein
MKKNLLMAVATCLSMTLFPLLSTGADVKPKSAMVATIPAEPVNPAEAKNLLLRLDEIKAMDKSDLKGTEKKALRKEVKEISNKLDSPYLYVSAGSLIIIILLLIILL